ncbi:hypothetical protein ABH926_010057 [Catenulispora sp. GP43]
MIKLRNTLVGAATLFAAVTLAGTPASAQAASPAGGGVSAATIREFWGTGATASAAHLDAANNASDIGCSPILSSGSAAQQSDGSWKAWINAWCGIL